jgi:nitroimidazol reductase NimA-like FMN-containing flavoprotein (pyridoxamine 5'-phosphate oxidase superfamily)
MDRTVRRIAARIGPQLSEECDLCRVTARELIEANQYMTLATADADGRPWVSPVWFAHDDYATFFWVSRPEARHSRNVEVRPQVAIVVFDSTVPEYTAEAVYVEAEAELVGPAEQDHAISVFSRRSQARGGEAWTLEDVSPPAALRLYRATASAHYLLDDHDRRVPVNPAAAA